MLIASIKRLPADTVIPKPKATAAFTIKCWSNRRGQPALIYSIPNHKNPLNRLEKGVTASEFELAYAELLASGQLTRAWFNSNLGACANEGGCNFTTIGGVFELLGLARYAERGTYARCQRPA